MSVAPVVEVFRALGDPTRLAVVERLGVSDASTSQLAEPFDTTLPSLLQHLDVLQAAGVVASHEHGRVRTYRVLPHAFGGTARWLDRQHDHFARRLQQLDRHLIDPNSEERSP